MSVRQIDTRLFLAVFQDIETLSTEMVNERWPASEFESDWFFRVGQRLAEDRLQADHNNRT